MLSTCLSLLARTSRPALLRPSFFTTASDATASEDVLKKKSFARWKQELGSYEKAQAKAIGGDPISMTDVGWLWHQGKVPLEAVNTFEAADIPRAIKAYEKAAALKYSPASSLLADLYFYGKEISSDRDAAKKWLNNVLDCTLLDEPSDAYIRGKALRQLAVLSRLSGDVKTSLARFNESVDLVSKHLNGNWAFILPHDPPGLWEMLSREQATLEDSQLLARNLSGFAVAEGRGREEDELRTAVALRSYTNALRNMEAHDKSFAISLWSESLDRFPSDYEQGSWGVTYLESFMRVYGHPMLQKSLCGVINEGRKPTVSVLGSALGNTAVWPSLAFGFKSTGHEALDCCATKSNELLQNLKGRAGDEARSNVTLIHGDAFDADLEGSDIIWSNDFQWGEEAQREVEAKAFEALSPGRCLVLYRRPKDDGLNWSERVVTRASVSWDPELPVFILLK